MKRGGNSAAKHGKSSRQNVVRRSVRITRTDPIHESGMEEQEPRVNDTRDEETRVNEIREEETRVNETREQETRVNDQEDEHPVSDNGDMHIDNSNGGTSPLHETGNDDQINDQEDPTDEPVRRPEPNHGADIPENRDDCPTIIAIGIRFPDSRVTSDITVMLRSHFDGPWPTWSKVPEKMKETLWVKFTEHFKWALWRHHQIRKAWETTNSNRFRDILCEERRRAEILANSDVPANWKNRNPNWIPRRFWNMLIDNVWSTENWQRKSTSGKQNRLKGNEKAEPTYTGGSIPIEAHKMKMRKELNRDPTEIELYDRTHKKNRGTGDYVCPKAKRVRETYEMNIEEKYPDPETRPSFDPSMWSQVSGGLSKQKSYSEWSARSEGSLEAEVYDRKIIDVEKMVEDVKLKTEGSMKEAKDEIMKFKKELSGMLRTMLQELQWTNTKYAGGSGCHQQNYMYGDEYSDGFSESDGGDEYNYDRVPRKHRVYGNRYDDERYDEDDDYYYDDDDDDDRYDGVAGFKKSKDCDGKKRQRSNGNKVQQSRKHKK